MTRSHRLSRSNAARMIAVTLAVALATPLSAQRRSGHRASGGNARAGNGNANPRSGASKTSTGAKTGNSGTNIGNGASKANNTNISPSAKSANVGNSQKNVNVNVNNSVHVNNQRNTAVRAGPVPYARPPYAYGGHRYYSHHAYHYHPYHPYRWGPAWHPWGFFVATLAATAIIVSVHNQQYHYDQGVYYAPSASGYVVVAAPVGATIPTLPPNSETVVVNQTTNNYYYGGTYYEKSGSGYKVVAPVAGTVVEHLPDGGKEVKMGDVTYVKVGDTYYQPIQQDGKSVYEVVEVKDAGEG